jgi:tRNA(Ile)-lysidine synthase
MNVEGRARTLPRRVIDAIRRTGMWSPGQRVLVAVSGGVDSTVLLHILHQTVGAHGADLGVVSVNHGLRAESMAEVGRVSEIARHIGIPFHEFHLNLESGANLAARARDGRRAAMLSLGFDFIATGHHEGDQAETVLHNMLRGSGARGLRGMQPRDGQWVRPLLFEPRPVIEMWARTQELSWDEDPSNPGSQRGLIRALMPQLDTLHGGASRALARSARLLAREDALISSLVDDAWTGVVRGEGISRMGLSKLHPALQLRILRKLIGSRTVRADPLESVVEGGLLEQGSLDLGGGLRLRLEKGILTVEHSS